MGRRASSSAISAAASAGPRPSWRTHATEPPPDDHFRPVEGGGDPAVLGPWLSASARELAAALRDVGPDAEPWTPVAGRTSSFYARRFAHETAHAPGRRHPRAGRASTTWRTTSRIDAVDEWMELGSLPEMLDFYPERRALLGPGRTVHLHATDTPAGRARRMGRRPDRDARLAARPREGRRRRAGAADRAAAGDLRPPLPADGTVEVLGDADWLDRWLRESSFG